MNAGFFPSTGITIGDYFFWILKSYNKPSYTRIIINQQWLIGIPIVGVETTCFLLQAAAERMLEATPEADLALAGFPSSWEEPQMFGKPKPVESLLVLVLGAGEAIFLGHF